MNHATFIFDPLCSWCYGASSALDRMEEDRLDIELLPIGLPGEARPIEPEFAGLLWGTDQIVARHTGQPFTRAYEALLHGGTAHLDSWPATLAVTAVMRTRPDRQIAALQALQVARFVNGRDTGRLAIVETILREIGLRRAADLLATAPSALAAAAEAAGHRARRLLGEHGVDGGPAMMITMPEGPRLLDAKLLIARARDERAPLAQIEDAPLLVCQAPGSADRLSFA